MDVNFLAKAAEQNLQIAEQNIRLDCVKIASSNKDLHSADMVIGYADTLVKYIMKTQDDPKPAGKGKS